MPINMGIIPMKEGQLSFREKVAYGMGDAGCNNAFPQLFLYGQFWLNASNGGDIAAFGKGR